MTLDGPVETTDGAMIRSNAPTRVGAATAAMTIDASAKVRTIKIAIRPLLSAPMLALAGLTVLAMSSFYLLLSAVPAHAAALGGPPAAGLATGVLMASTIAGELAAPRLIARLGRRSALTLSLLFMALPALASFAASGPMVMFSCAARGLGLGVLLVAACGLAVLLAPTGRRAEAMGVYGLASAIPAIVCVPLGPWVLARWGGEVMAPVAGGLALAGVVFMPMLPRLAPRMAEVSRSHQTLALNRAIWPVVALATGAIVIGATVTFLPTAHDEVRPETIAIALLTQGLASASARWAVGRRIDRHGPGAGAVVGVVLALVGVVVLALPGDSAVIVGATLSGAAFGVLQSATLAQLMARAGPAQVDAAGAVWNGAYDAGLGIGGLAVGALASGVGYSTAFVATAVGQALLAFWVFYRFERRPPC